MDTTQTAARTTDPIMPTVARNTTTARTGRVDSQVTQLPTFVSTWANIVSSLERFCLFFSASIDLQGIS